MESQTKILIWVAIAGLLAFTFWRNYGVLAKGSVILDSAFGKDDDKTNEQKELIQKIHTSYTMNSAPTEGDKLKTSFGFYRFNKGAWIKYAEIWDK
jgi:hypothetical protein